MELHHTILTILIFGTIGGLINWFRDNTQESRWWKSILKGIGASLIVPLFLELVKSDIVSVDQSGWYNYFIFGGLCLITAIFSDKFIDSIGEKLIKKVEDVENTMNEIEDSKNEIDNADEIVFENVTVENKDESEEDIRKVIRAIVNSKYSYRTVMGIQKETGLDKNRIIEILVTLRENGTAASKKNKRGNGIWKIIVK